MTSVHVGKLRFCQGHIIRILVIGIRKSGTNIYLAVIVPVDEGWVEVAGPGLDHTGNVDGGALLYEPLLKSYIW